MASVCSRGKWEYKDILQLGFGEWRNLDEVPSACGTVDFGRVISSLVGMGRKNRFDLTSPILDSGLAKALKHQDCVSLVLNIWFRCKKSKFAIHSVRLSCRSIMCY